MATSHSIQSMAPSIFTEFSGPSFSSDAGRSDSDHSCSGASLRHIMACWRINETSGTGYSLVWYVLLESNGSIVDLSGVDSIQHLNVPPANVDRHKARQCVKAVVPLMEVRSNIRGLHTDHIPIYCFAYDGSRYKFLSSSAVGPTLQGGSEAFFNSILGLCGYPGVQVQLMLARALYIAPDATNRLDKSCLGVKGKQLKVAYDRRCQKHYMIAWQPMLPYLIRKENAPRMECLADLLGSVGVL